MEFYRQKMRYVRDLAEMSLANNSSPEQAAAFREILGNGSNTSKRVFSLAICSLVKSTPSASSLLLDRTLPAGVSYVGGGGESIAYRIGNTVTKINKRSIDMDEADRHQLAVTEIAKQSIVDAYLGAIAVPQAISVDQHPVFPKLRATQITQQFCAYNQLDDVFPRRQPYINQDSLRELLACDASLEDSLYHFARQGLAMADDEGLIPDIAGRGNIGVTYSETDAARRLVLIDRQPIDLTLGNTNLLHIRPQLHALRSYLGSPIPA